MQEVSLYVHIPFCIKKCLYCDFPSYCGKDSLMIDYAKALNLEIKKNMKDKLVKTIFIGGGTPTYLSLEGWHILGEALSELNRKEDIEFTVECNPGTIDREKLMFFKKIGVNRLSIGLQAWQDNLLKDLGRIHTLKEFLHSFNLARELGFNNINIDIMFGLPNQNLMHWEETLDKVIELSPEHVSSYGLIIEEETPFYNLNEKGKLILPEENLEREMYQRAVEKLKEKGYFQYEISNFSKAHRECIHNLVYWNLEEYIGCGTSAHSYLHKERYRNEDIIEKYIGRIFKEGCAIVEKNINTIEDEMEEFMFLGLRKINGIQEEVFKKRFDKKIDEVYAEIIKKHCELGLLIREKGRISLSQRGIEISNSILSDFIL